MAKKKLIGNEIEDQKAITLKEVTNLLGGEGNEALAMFFIEWLNNGMNAKRAYLKYHPNVTEKSAEVLGPRELSKVKIPLVLEALELGATSYFTQLRAGLNAGRSVVLKKYDKTGKVVKELSINQPDHKTRRLYHEAQGKMLGIEHDGPSNITQNNFDFSNLGAAIARDSMQRGLEP